MTNQENQIIEELANDIYSLKSCDTYFEGNCKLLAYDLVTLGWVKLTEDSVVVSKTILREELRNLEMQVSKETAEKIYLQAKAIVNATKHMVQGREYLHIEVLKEIIKSCAVEIKE